MEEYNAKLKKGQSPKEQAIIEKFEEIEIFSRNTDFAHLQMKFHPLKVTGLYTSYFSLLDFQGDFFFNDYLRNAAGV